MIQVRGAILIVYARGDIYQGYECQKRIQCEHRTYDTRHVHLTQNPTAFSRALVLPHHVHYESAAASQAWYTVNDTPNGFLLNPPSLSWIHTLIGC